MDRDSKYFGHWNHQHDDYYHDISGIRAWLRKWCHLAYQDTLTDYVRIALGHLVLDDIWYRYKDENMSHEEIIKSAYRSYAQRRYGRCHFKE